MSALLEALQERALLALGAEVSGATRNLYGMVYLIACLPTDLEQELTLRISLENENQKNEALA
jgi:hypothetical protein